MSEIAIDSENLAKIYGGFAAVCGINLNVPRGAIYGFLGRNGAGKTTTIKMLLGLTRPTSGSGHVLGMDVRGGRMGILRRTAFVSEKKSLYPSLTPSELVQFSRGFYPTWSDGAVDKYARLLEIPMKQRFEKLSNGNQTKVWLLLALSQGADLLILDEPTTALDPITVDQLMHVLAEDALDRGCTIFFSSHQLEEVERIAEYVGFIDHGRLLMEARLDDIKSDFRLITAAGNSLPVETSSQVLSVAIEEDFYRYVVTKDADDFAARLSRNGATVTEIAPLGLREIFLQLVKKGVMMYFWKCWRDTRSFFAVFFIIAAVVMPVAAVVCKRTHLMEDFGAEAFVSTFAMITIAVALALGTLCASEEFADRAIHFLFTKPRSRAYFVWATWTVGLLELLAVVAVNFLAGCTALAHSTGHPFQTVLFGSVKILLLEGPLIPCLLIYSFTFSLTTILRNGLRGSGASMAILVGLPLFAAAIRFRWKIDLPLPPERIGSLTPVVSDVVWAFIALLFVCAARLVVERTEI